MKAKLEHLPKEKEESFVVKNFDYSYYPTPWHYHPEYELVLVTESTGRRYIGDHICNFKPGNLALIGPNLPHTYRNEAHYYQSENNLRARSIVIHFSEDTFGNNLLMLPEIKPIRNLLENSRFGLDISGKTNILISEKLQRIVSLSGLQRWFCLLEMLVILSESKELKPICQSSFVGKNDKESMRLCLVFDWILCNYDKPLRVTEAAVICNMSESAFSRFFSQRTRKTFSSYINELRLNKASLFLKENELSVTEICYKSGFNNISNFNRQFLKQYQVSPIKYRNMFLELS